MLPIASCQLPRREFDNWALLALQIESRAFQRRAERKVVVLVVSVRGYRSQYQEVAGVAEEKVSFFTHVPNAVPRH